MKELLETLARLMENIVTEPDEQGHMDADGYLIACIRVLMLGADRKEDVIPACQRIVKAYELIRKWYA